MNVSLLTSAAVGQPPFPPPSRQKPRIPTANNRHNRIPPPPLLTTAPNLKKSTTAAAARTEVNATASEAIPPMNLLFVEMGVGYDQHGQDVTAAAVRACRDAITSNSIPAFRGGLIPGVSTDSMKLQIKLGVPRSTQHLLDVERVKSVFPYGRIVKLEVVDGGMICSSGVCLEAMGDKNDDCHIVNAAVYVGY